MPEYGMNRNTEGYLDSTPYTAMLQAPKPGEIWSYDAYEVLILRNHGTFCNILTLVESSKDTQSIPVMSHSMRFTNPAMIRYCFNSGMGRFVKKIPDSDFGAILDAVREAMGFTPAGDNGENPAPKADPAEIEALKTRLILERREAEKAKAKFDVLQGMYDALLGRLLSKGADD